LPLFLSAPLFAAADIFFEEKEIKQIYSRAADQRDDDKPPKFTTNVSKIPNQESRGRENSLPFPADIPFLDPFLELVECPPQENGKIYN
jgi:hypothetical protein